MIIMLTVQLIATSLLRSKLKKNYIMTINDNWLLLLTEKSYKKVKI